MYFVSEYMADNEKDNILIYTVNFINKLLFVCYKSTYLEAFAFIAGSTKIFNFIC